MTDYTNNPYASPAYAAELEPITWGDLIDRAIFCAAISVCAGILITRPAPFAFYAYSESALPWPNEFIFNDYFLWLLASYFVGAGGNLFWRPDPKPLILLRGFGVIAALILAAYIIFANVVPSVVWVFYQN